MGLPDCLSQDWKELRRIKPSLVLSPYLALNVTTRVHGQFRPSEKHAFHLQF